MCKTDLKIGLSVWVWARSKVNVIWRRHWQRVFDRQVIVPWVKKVSTGKFFARLIAEWQGQMGEAVKKEDDVLAKVIVGMFSFVHGGRGEIRSQEREREKAPFFS